MDESQRLEALEVKCAWLEDALQTLSTALYRHDREMAVLRGQVEVLRQRQDAAGETPAAGSTPAEIPPHY